MSQDLVVVLLRQINNSLPADIKKIPNMNSDLSFAQIYLLKGLYDHGEMGVKPASLSALSREAGFSKATVCAALKKLRKNGYIQMKICVQDNRRKEIFLTKKAVESRSDVTQFISTLDQILCEGIPQKDLEIMLKSLWIILENEKKLKEQILK